MRIQKIRVLVLYNKGQLCGVPVIRDEIVAVQFQCFGTGSLFLALILTRAVQIAQFWA